jgi:anti-sigma regulatory factor (Ser/Thr protein kinase)
MSLTGHARRFVRGGAGSLVHLDRDERCEVPTVVDEPSSEVFVHEALYYGDLDEYLAGTLPFIRGGLAADEPVLVAVPAGNLALIRERLGADAARVRFLDMADAGRNPNRIIPWVLRAFVEEHWPIRVRIIGEPIFVGRTPDEIGLCVQHEALINVALMGMDAIVLCPYDVAAMPDIIADAEHTHPVVVDRDGSRRPGEYLDPHIVVSGYNRPLPEPSGVEDALVFDLRRLGDLRSVVGQHATDAGLPPDRVRDLQVAVTEIGTNALTHGGPGLATMRAWSDCSRVVYEIRGAGHIADPLAGRIVPPVTAKRGRGLLVANRLCDLVQTHTLPSGTVTRLHVRRPLPD